jgi:hypothetical protein
VLENALARDWKQFIVKLAHFHNVMSDENLGEITEKDITVTFHDNIVVDENLEKEVFRAEIELGVRAEWEYRVKFFGETEDEAKLFIETNIDSSSIDEEFDNPAPTPNPNETEDEFIARFMSNEMMIEEYPAEDQRATRAFDAWQSGGS